MKNPPRWGRAALVAAVVGAYATVAVAIIRGEAPPLWFTIPFAVSYLVILNLATVFPNLQIFTDAISHGPRGARGVAITFDDGPHPIHTREVLDALDRYDAKATFFMLGEKAEAHPDVVREVAARGHTLAIHGWTHDRWLNLRHEDRIASDLTRSAALLGELSGTRREPHGIFFRPPLGFTSPRTMVVVRRLGMSIVGYSARAYDGLDFTNPTRVLGRIAPRLEDGAIVLMHDSAERGDRRPASVGALTLILEEMRLRGLVGVGLDAWRPLLGEAGLLRLRPGVRAEGVEESPESRPGPRARQLRGHPGTEGTRSAAGTQE